MSLSSGISKHDFLMQQKYKKCRTAGQRYSADFFLYIYQMKVSGSKTYPILKSTGDYIVSLICLLILSPLIIILSLTILLTGGGPVLYSQKRTGLNDKSFNIYKFRSLKHGTHLGTDLIVDKNDTRISRIGRFMRKYKLDEIPNFINVLSGDMSLVGPRPEQKYYIDKIVLKAPDYRKLLEVKPGMTSWGQVRYGYASTVDGMIERLQYDLYYIEHRSLLFDLKILLHTIGIVFRGRGI
jgi:lipopolysaccharide/colanic/teichoic acid biosynthesis glycosyltransferase